MSSNAASDILGATTVFMIVIGVLIGIAVIVIGMRLKRQRVAGEKDLAARRIAAHVDEFPATEAVAVPDVAIDAAPAVIAETPVVAPSPAAPQPVAATPAGVATAAPAATEGDITQLKGLGPKLAATLAQLGYTRLDQIAALTPQQADELDARLGTFQGRMTRDRWIEQARLLVAGDRVGYEAAFGKLG
jgi:predicted flap endonuclease-1-like 5' DNA nuclease